MAKRPEVGIIMGSQSDWATMRHAAEILNELGVAHEKRIVSAHRTPGRLAEYARTARERGIKVIIAGAGGAAHLSGMVAAQTSIPVCGVPVESKVLKGEDSLLSTVQMPAGVPVATFAIGEAGATNAALYAAAMLAISDPDLAYRLDWFRKKQTETVPEAPLSPDVDVKNVIAWGKTKVLYGSKEDPKSAYAHSKDVVTWGDTHSMRMPDKGNWSNAVTCTMFECFKSKDIPVAYVRRVDPQTFLTRRCTMLPYEAVVYRVVGESSSIAKRMPKVRRGVVLDEPIFQLHLKTSGKRFRNIALQCDDPLIVVTERKVELFLPNRPVNEQTAMWSVARSQAEDYLPGFPRIEELERLSLQAMAVGAEAFRWVNAVLEDGKFEFGFDGEGELLLADVFDVDSMRGRTFDGRVFSKQPIRDGGEDAVLKQIAAYQLGVHLAQEIQNRL